MSDPKIVEIADRIKNELRAAGDFVRRNENDIIENRRSLARIWFATYIALKEAGFTDAQALELCIKN